MNDYKRVLIKLSGEALSGDTGFGFSDKIITEIVKEIVSLSKEGKEIAIVLGGGNFFRGRGADEMPREEADKIGMLATVMNSIYIKNEIIRFGGKAEVMNSFAMAKITEIINAEKAKKKMSKGEIIIFSGGTGNPFFTTDSAAVLRALEISADIMLFAKNIDGIYSDDPKKNSDAIKYDELTYSEILSKNLKAIDASAAGTARDFGINTIVFELKPGNIKKAISGKKIGTLIKE
jgi:uridylate kinase